MIIDDLSGAPLSPRVGAIGIEHQSSISTIQTSAIADVGSSKDVGDSL